LLESDPKINNFTVNLFAMIKNKLRSLFVLCLTGTVFSSFSQGEANKWYFGNKAGLDFSTTPPSNLSNGQIMTVAGCSSIADASGGLVFYTDGDTIWNKQHQVMANGTGLMGNDFSSQSALIIKQPGNNNMYFVFTVAANGNLNGLNYSLVDMNLAAGMGSVTTKNAPLNSPSTEKLCAVRHCNNIDVWVITHDLGSNSFRVYLITAAGMNALPVVSGIGPILPTSDAPGCMKVSPNGRKLAVMAPGTNSSGLFDFDASTGAVYNYMALTNLSSPYGCEFSPDGTKLYVGHQNSSQICQLDLCAGSSAAILSSSFTISMPPASFIGALQLAPNGKIYVARPLQPFLGVINFPNLAGAASNYVNTGISLGTGGCRSGLPGFQANYVKQVPSSFTFAVNCASVSFSQGTLAPLQAGCSASSYSYSSLSWMFGDPASGSADTSAANSPTHAYPGPGTYKIKLAYNSACGSDTIRGSVTLTGLPSLTITGKTTICNGEMALLDARGATTYSWNTGAITSIISPSPNIATTYTVTGTTGGCSISKTVTVLVLTCSGLEEIEGALQNLRMYPNPGKNSLVTEIELPAKLTVYTATGQLIYRTTIASGLSSIDTSTWPNGIYTVCYTVKDKTTTKKFIKLDTD
jgi:hypothetical protein